ncbi:MAG: tRNA lysidine(34) synthetase TilS [Alphaproteobacteria bacterium]|nr:tRNA lysidine(34) synthetase TilS [Alphaproteobacteria bacterium]
MALSLQDFKTNFKNILQGHDGPIAVGVSGGPDSMALLKLISAAGEHSSIHALIVDHGLRPESADEAKAVQARIENWPHVQAHILTWGGGAQTRIQEEARRARYDLMVAHCAAHDISYLCLAHHMDDQAETVLFRLAKGSGLDGLAGMASLQPFDNDLTLVRPLLDVPKDDLVEFCTAQGIEVVADPSNEAEKFARVRLRRSAEILEEEGLSASRLATTAKRIARARSALEALADEAFEKNCLEKNTKRIVLRYDIINESLDEIGFRAILKAIKTLQPGEDYLPRMQKIEALFDDLKAEKSFRKRTLGGLIFERDDKEGHILIAVENA